MEDIKPYASSAEPVYTPPHLRTRPVPDVPEDVEFIREHLNDPNMPFPGDRKSETFSDLELENKTVKGAYSPSDLDLDSHADRYSTSRAESRNSSAIDDFDDESPYPEVRAAVSNTDDPSMPVNTFRMWTLGLFWIILLPIVNTALGLRYPTMYITGLIIQLVVLPMGKFMERVLPTRNFNTFGYVWTLNPGPFNIKEHVAVTIMANVSYSGGYATDIFLAQRMFYNQKPGLAYQLLLVIGMQAYGFSLAGLMRRWTVYPSNMLWPGAIVNSALFNTLHKNFGKSDRGHITRERFFLFVFLGAIAYYFLPGFLFTALSMFNWVCWIAPNNVTVNTLFGASGLGMSGLTFDWSMISYIASPMVTPWWAEANILVSFVFWFWIVAPAMYFSNTFNSAFLPISSYYSFDNTGNVYNATQVVTNGVFDIEKYKAYSPLFLSTTLTLQYGLAFAAFPAVLIHTFLWYRRDIVRRFRSSSMERDVHHRLMQAYPETPGWWFAIVGVVSLVFIIIAIEIEDVSIPVWAALLAAFLSAVTAIPLAMIQAIANTQIGFNVMYEMIFGFMLPGRPVGNTIFKGIGYMGSYQAALFCGDLKLGQYMKIPTRTMFRIQVIAVLFATILATLTQQWMIDNITDLCLPTQKQHFICPSTNSFATASLIWGGIGPDRMFGPDALYRPLLWFFLVGIILPIPPYFLARRFPTSMWRYINVPVILTGITSVPPASGLNYISWGIVGFIFNFYIRRFHFRWWMRYNYITSAALDAGTVFAVVFIFLALQLPKDGTISLDWWGNTVWMNTADSMGIPLKSLSEGATFGPSSWS